MSASEMDSVGQLNAGWGVCGFTSTFYAMYQQNPGTRGWLVNATAAYSVLYEITDYLKALQAAASPLLKDITAFTQSFGGPFAKFTIEDYIARVDNSSETTRKFLTFGSDLKSHDDPLRREGLFGIALPPQAVADYIERMWKWKATITEFKAADLSGDAIVGVRDLRNDKMKMYHKLCHYLYRGGGKYYSWGKSFPSLAAAGGAKKEYEICYAITIRKY